jgi:hypothetical protein
MHLEYGPLYVRGLCQIYIADFRDLAMLHTEFVSVHITEDIFRA